MNDRTKFITGIVDTAFGGGINYWAEIDGEEIREYDDEGPVGEWIRVTPSLVEEGIAAVKDPSFQIRDDILMTILLSDRSNYAGEIDIEAADVIIQAAIFGMIVYG